MMQVDERKRALIERLAHGPVIIGDGGMGTWLYQCGAPFDAVFEYLNLVDPDLVSRVHADYLQAGAELVETNTFGANGLRLEGFGLSGKTRQINLAGAKLARKAAGSGRWVAGSVGPLVTPRGREEGPDLAGRAAYYREQMAALAEGGVDAFLLETFSRTDDLCLAIAIAKELGLPAIAQLAFAEGGYTGDGLTVEEAMERVTPAAPAAVGANCGAGPRELLQVVKRLAAATELPLSAFPNSGFPEYVNGRHIYLATPEYFARLGQEMIAAGVGLIGGCCGTTPEHIAALAPAVAESRPGMRSPTPVVPRSLTPAAAAPAEPRRGFLAAWGTRPVLTVELDPPKGLDVTSLMQRARRLAEAGVDAINLAENPLARIRMGNLALASRIQDEVGVEVIAHVTGRDRNLIGLHSELMGAHLLGLRTILAVTGDPVAVSGESGATSVFDVNSVGLLEILNALNHGRNLYGADLNGRTDFLLGAAFNPNVKDLAGQLRKLEKKVAAGARFVETQPVYDPVVLEKTLAAFRELQIPVLVGIMPLVSERNAEFLHNEVPGIRLPEDVRRRMRGKAGAAGAAEGMAIAGELIAAAGEAGAQGYYLVPPFGKVDLALELMQLIRRRQGRP